MQRPMKGTCSSRPALANAPISCSALEGTERKLGIVGRRRKTSVTTVGDKQSAVTEALGAHLPYLEAGAHEIVLIDADDGGLV